MTWINSRSGMRQYRSVSPVYEHSRIAQSVWDAIGTEYDVFMDKSRELMFQIVPETSDFLLYMWERRYGVTAVSDDIEERRNAVINRRSFRKPISPMRLQVYLSALSRRSVAIDEHLADYTFGVYFTNQTGSTWPVNYSLMFQVVNRLKQAHMCFEMGFIADAAVSVGVSVSSALFELPVCGTIPQANIVGARAEPAIDITDGLNVLAYLLNPTSDVSFAGTYPQPNIEGARSEPALDVSDGLATIAYPQNMTSDASNAGTYPHNNLAGHHDGMAMTATCDAYRIEFVPCGTKACGE